MKAGTMAAELRALARAAEDHAREATADRLRGFHEGRADALREVADRLDALERERVDPAERRA